MKKLLSVTLIAFLIQASFAQIPNAGFENWINMGTYENPESWGTMNNNTASSSIFTAIKGTPGNPGSAFLKLISLKVGSDVVNGIAVSGRLDSTTLEPLTGFAFNLRPQSITGKWQHMIFGTRQGSVSATLTRWNTASGQRENIASATETLAGMVMSWSTFDIPFIYESAENPDTCIIVLKASGNGPTSNDYLWVDDLAFSGSVQGTGPGSLKDPVVSIFPNPTNDYLRIRFSSQTVKDCKLLLSDMAGAIVCSLQLENNPSELITTGFASGTYIYKIYTAFGIRIAEGKITIQH